MVEDVEKFRTELQVEALGKPEVFEQGLVKIHQTRSNERISSEVSVASRAWRLEE